MRQSFELPGFTTLADTAQALRASRNDSLYRKVFDALGEVGRSILEVLWLEPGQTPRTRSWNDLKRDAPLGNATGVTAMVKRQTWFNQFGDLTVALSGVSQRKRDASQPRVSLGIKTIKDLKR